MSTSSCCNEEHNKKYNVNKTMLLSLAFGLSVLLLTVFSSPEFSAAGDKNIAQLITSNYICSSGFYFISPYLSMLFHIFYYLFPNINWWLVYSLFIVFVGSVTFTYIIFNLQGINWFTMFTGIIFNMVYMHLICFAPVNFTQTAVISALSGGLLLMNSIEYKANRIISEVLGFILLILSGFTRWKATLLCIPWLLMICLYCIMQAKNKIKKSFYNKCLIVIPVSFIIVMLANWTYGINEPLWREYSRSNSDRENIYDYLQGYPAWSEGKNEYIAAGADESIMDMIKSNYASDSNYFSSENLERIVKLRGDCSVSISYIFIRLSKYSSVLICLL